jgi:hypothetical protein
MSRLFGGVIQNGYVVRDEGVSELWICYPLTDEETPHSERGER